MSELIPSELKRATQALLESLNLTIAGLRAQRDSTMKQALFVVRISHDTYGRLVAISEHESITLSREAEHCLDGKPLFSPHSSHFREGYLEFFHHAEVNTDHTPYPSDFDWSTQSFGYLGLELTRARVSTAQAPLWALGALGAIAAGNEPREEELVARTAEDLAHGSPEADDWFGQATLLDEAQGASLEAIRLDLSADDAAVRYPALVRAAAREACIALLPALHPANRTPSANVLFVLASHALQLLIAPGIPERPTRRSVRNWLRGPMESALNPYWAAREQALNAPVALDLRVRAYSVQRASLSLDDFLGTALRHEINENDYQTMLRDAGLEGFPPGCENSAALGVTLRLLGDSMVQRVDLLRALVAHARPHLCSFLDFLNPGADYALLDRFRLGDHDAALVVELSEPTPSVANHWGIFQNGEVFGQINNHELLEPIAGDVCHRNESTWFARAPIPIAQRHLPSPLAHEYLLYRDYHHAPRDRVGCMVTFTRLTLQLLAALRTSDQLVNAAAVDSTLDAPTIRGGWTSSRSTPLALGELHRIAFSTPEPTHLNAFWGAPEAETRARILLQLMVELRNGMQHPENRAGVDRLTDSQIASMLGEWCPSFERLVELLVGVFHQTVLLIASTPEKRAADRGYVQPLTLLRGDRGPPERVRMSLAAGVGTLDRDTIYVVQANWKNPGEGPPRELPLGGSGKTLTMRSPAPRGHLAFPVHRELLRYDADSRRFEYATHSIGEELRQRAHGDEREVAPMRWPARAPTPGWLPSEVIAQIFPARA